jgi:hypothetical protein
MIDLTIPSQSSGERRREEREKKVTGVLAGMASGQLGRREASGKSIDLAAGQGRRGAEQWPLVQTIADRGTSVDLVSRSVAEQMVREGVVGRIEPMSKPMMIQFGVDSAKAPAVGKICGAGLLTELFVMEETLPIMLISDITFTEKGVVFVEDNDELIGVAAGCVVVRGWRDSTAPRSSTEAMWQLNLRELLRQSDPRLARRAEDLREQLSAQMVVNMMIKQPQSIEEESS